MALIDELRSQLKPNKHELDLGLEQQPVVAEEIGRQVAYLRGMTEKAVADLKRTEAAAYMDFRNGATKMSVEDIKASVTLSAEVGKARHTMLALEQELAEWESLQSAWRDRGYSLKGLGELYTAGYFDARGQTVRGEPQAVHQQRRDRMNEARQGEHGVTRRRMAE